MGQNDNKIQVLVEPFPHGVFRTKEHIYKIRGTKVEFIIREYFRAINKEVKNFPTNISHFFKGKRFKLLGYVDSDFHSDFDSRLKGPIKINDQVVQPFVNETQDPGNPNQKIWTFGINVNTDLKIEDFYWIELHCLLEDYVGKIGSNLYGFGVVNQMSDVPISTEIIVSVPNIPEGIFAKKITEIERLSPLPNNVYDDVGFRIYSWPITKARPRQIDRIDIWYTIRTKYTPLIKNMIYVLAGAFLGVVGSLVFSEVTNFFYRLKLYFSG